MRKMGISDVDLRGKRVLMRVDFNVPLDDSGKVTDDSRIRAALPTIQHAVKNGGKVILMSHLGRPDGKVVESMRMTPVAGRLEELLGKPVKKAADCIGPEAERMVAVTAPGEVLLLENTRFHVEEEANDPKFAKQLASLGDVFINDAFGTAHRAHASTEGVAHYLTSAAGFLLEKEIDYLSKLVESPAQPFVALLGGAKVSDKIGVIENLMSRVKVILVGGAMAYTFKVAQGIGVGKSKVETKLVDAARRMLDTCRKAGAEIALPVDHVVAASMDERAQRKTVDDGQVPADWLALDIGPKTAKLYCDKLQPAKTVFWNGPMGVFEMAPFADGTRKVGECLARLKATKVAGGGDTVAALAAFGLTSKMTHVSTGGGASLEYLEGKKLPGVEALTDRK